MKQDSIAISLYCRVWDTELQMPPQYEMSSIRVMALLKFLCKVAVMLLPLVMSGCNKTASFSDPRPNFANSVVFSPLKFRIGARNEDFAIGLIAAKEGDYATTFEEFYPLAVQGNREAQFWLYWMYYNGVGVPFDPVEAMRWLQQSAWKNYPLAKEHLCRRTYCWGPGVTVLP